MKKYLFLVISLIFTVVGLISCDDEYSDFMTSDVKTGGILNPTEAIAYKLGSTPSFNVTLDIPKGPGIKAVEIYKKFTEYDSEGDVVSVKGPILDRTVDINSGNKTEDVSVNVSYTYAQLSQGLNMPADENVLNIGDGWTLSYVSIMDDDRKVDLAYKTSVAVANFFAGGYTKDIKYFHPTAGGSYPTEPYSAYTEDVNLIALNSSQCSDWFGVWEDNKITININPTDYTVTLTFERADAVQGDPNNPANVCSYDPETGILKLYYFYPGAGGNRIFWAVYTPSN